MLWQKPAKISVLIVGVIPDTHSPWSHPKAIDHCDRIFSKWKVDRIVHLGDEIDAHSFSAKWPISPDGPSPSHELELAIADLKRFYRRFPEVTVCESNHGLRIFKKCLVSGVPSRVLKRYSEILEYGKGWELQENVEIDGVLYHHGEGFNRTSWRSMHEKFNQSAVCGHIHSNAGIQFSSRGPKEKKLFSMNVGCLIDLDISKRLANAFNPFGYGKHLSEKPFLACGIVIDGVHPMLFPLL